jgi:hypothetical protein
MPGFLLHQGAIVMCSHPPGQAQPTTVSPRVKVSNQPIVTQPTPYTVAGCALTTTTAPPCATAAWTSAAIRVTSLKLPVLLQDSISQCVPTVTPLVVTATQIRVKGI